jgi:hypothetical protein
MFNRSKILTNSQRLNNLINYDNILPREKLVAATEFFGIFKSDPNAHIEKYIKHFNALKTDIMSSRDYMKDVISNRENECKDLKLMVSGKKINVSKFKELKPEKYCFSYKVFTQFEEDLPHIDNFIKVVVAAKTATDDNTMNDFFNIINTNIRRCESLSIVNDKYKEPVVVISDWACRQLDKDRTYEELGYPRNFVDIAIRRFTEDEKFIRDLFNIYESLSHRSENLIDKIKQNKPNVTTCCIICWQLFFIVKILNTTIGAFSTIHTFSLMAAKKIAHSYE